MAGTEIAKEEIAFGNSVKTFGTFVPYLTPALGERAGGLAERMCLRTVAPHPQWEEDESKAQETRDPLGEEGFLGQETPLVSAGGWLVQY